MARLCDHRFVLETQTETGFGFDFAQRRQRLALTVWRKEAVNVLYNETATSKIHRKLVSYK